MTNKELFQINEPWATEQNLCFLLQIYWDKINEKDNKRYQSMPINPVSFAKEFLKDETLVDTNIVELSKMESLQDNCIDGESS